MQLIATRLTLLSVSLHAESEANGKGTQLYLFYPFLATKYFIEFTTHYAIVGFHMLPICSILTGKSMIHSY